MPNYCDFAEIHTIFSFSSSDQRRRRPVSTTSSRSTRALRLSLSIGTVLKTAPHLTRWPSAEGYDDRAISLAENWTGETEVQTKFLHLFGDFFSTGHFDAQERKFGRHFKEIFSELYREFESHLVRQQVIDITERIVVPAIRATFPAVSVRIRESSQLRARITPHFSDQRAQFSERHFVSAVLVAMMVHFPQVDLADPL